MEVEGLRVKLSASQTTAAAGAPGQGSGLADSMGSGGGEAYGGSTSLAAARNEEQVGRQTLRLDGHMYRERKSERHRESWSVSVSLSLSICWGGGRGRAVSALIDLEDCMPKDIEMV